MSQAAGELEATGEAVDWHSDGAGAFAVGGPLGDNGLSGKKLVAEAYGTVVPVGGGTVHGKNPLTPDVRSQRLSRDLSVRRLREEGADEATVWVVFRPGEEEPRWVEERVVVAGCLRPASRSRRNLESTVAFREGVRTGRRLPRPRR